MPTCLVCPDRPHIDDHALVDHIRLMHPDQWERVETWVDGDTVIYDMTLEPCQFIGDWPDLAEERP